MISEIINSVIGAVIAGLFSVYIFHKKEKKIENTNQIAYVKEEDKRIRERNIKFNQWKQSLTLITDNLNINLPNSKHPILFSNAFENSDNQLNNLNYILTNQESEKLENLYILCKENYEKLVHYKTQQGIDDNFQKLRKISIDSFENLFDCFK